MKTWSSRWMIVAGACLLTAGAAEAGDKAPASGKPALAGDASSVYVQTARRGTFKPAGKGSPNEYVLTLQGVGGSTVYFSHGARRAAGGVATEEFLPTFFAGGRPPTASVNLASEERGAVVELSDPRYDARRGTLTYRAKVLGDRRPLGASVWPPAIAPSLPASFGAVSVFLSPHCSDGYPTCWGGPSGVQGCPTACGALDEEVGYCWNWGAWACEPCSDDGYKCTEENICGSNSPNGLECLGSCSTFRQNCSG